MAPYGEKGSFRESCLCKLRCSALVAGFGEKAVFLESSVRGISISVLWWLAVARRQFPGVVCWWELSRSVLVTCFGEKAVLGSCVVVEAQPQCLARRQFRGVVCWWEDNRSVLVARFGEKGDVLSVVSHVFGGFLWRENNFGASLWVVRASKS